MNKDGFEDSGKEMQSQVEERQDNVAQADLERAESKSFPLIGLLQERYDCNREQAEVEFKRRLSQI